MPVLQVVLSFSSDISHLYYTFCMPWPFHPFSFIIQIIFCKGDKLQHPSLRTVVGFLLLPKLMLVSTNYSTLSTADRHITMHRYSPQTVPQGGRGGQDKQSCTTHLHAIYFQALNYAWCVPLQMNVLRKLKWYVGRKCVGYTWQSEGIWPIRTVEGVRKVSLTAQSAVSIQLCSINCMLTAE